jgi:tetratricopeptide (TPR) repeat protein
VGVRIDVMASLIEWQRQAVRALQEGRVDDGIAAYRAVIAGGGGDAIAWYNLAYLLRCARRFDEALAAYAEALAKGIDRAEEVHLNRAVILSEYREADGAAEAELRLALSIAPGFVPAWLNLGNLHEDRGEAAAAREVYGRVLAIDPGNPRALARLAAIDIFEGRAGEAIARLEGQRIDDPEPLFALGQALDAEGRFDAAFAAFATANRRVHDATPPERRFDPRMQERIVDGLIAASPIKERSLSADADQEAPIFICGMFRSGSTLVEQMLSRHPRVIRGGELEILPAMTARFANDPGALLRLSEAEIATMRARYLGELLALHPGAARVTDKRPDNFLHIGLIKRMFPAAKIVHTLRDDLDTALSIYFLHFDDSIAYGNDLTCIGHWIAQYHRLMAHWQQLYPGDIHDLSYDDLVREPEPVLRSLLSFCGLDWTDRVLAPENDEGIVRTASVWQVRQRLHRRSSGRARHYARHLRPLTDALRIAPIDG